MVVSGQMALLLWRSNDGTAEGGGGGGTVGYDGVDFGENTKSLKFLCFVFVFGFGVRF